MSAFKLHVISCGHGDTLLLQMPKRKWALIDCHLPGAEALERFFKLTDSLGIQRLDYIVLTHPDSDHYKGMRHVLTHFSEGGRQIGYFCTSGASPSHVMKLLQSRGLSDDDVAEYGELFRTVNDLRKRNLLKRHALHDQVATIRVSGKRRGMSLIAIGPDYDRIATAEDATLAELKHPALDVNECSVVLVAQYVTRFASHRFFLPGDMEGGGLTRALERWDIHPDKVGVDTTFNFIKVPHHGSPNGHDSALVARKVSGRIGAAVISCGTSYDLPSRDVIKDYLSNGWQVFCTTPRVKPVKAASALQATNQRTAGKSAVVSYSVTVAAGIFNRIRIGPRSAQITTNELGNYI